MLNQETAETAELLRRAGRGDAQAPGELFDQNRDRLRRMVELRMDGRLRGRLDPSDVLQEAYLEFSRSLAIYLRRPDIPIYLWLRLIAGRKLQALHRSHLGAKIRDAHREIQLPTEDPTEFGAPSYAATPRSRQDTPSETLTRCELQQRVHESLTELSGMDREILLLRHFEQLSNAEAAHVLGISEAAASIRFVRAIKRLRRVMIGEL